MKIINLRHQASHESGNGPFKKIYANYASSATFIKSAKIMLVFPNYAKYHASTIDKGLIAQKNNEKRVFQNSGSVRTSHAREVVINYSHAC